MRWLRNQNPNPPPDATRSRPSGWAAPRPPTRCASTPPRASSWAGDRLSLPASSRCHGPRLRCVEAVWCSASLCCRGPRLRCVETVCCSASLCSPWTCPRCVCTTARMSSRLTQPAIGRHRLQPVSPPPRALQVLVAVYENGNVDMWDVRGQRLDRRCVCSPCTRHRAAPGQEVRGVDCGGSAWTGGVCDHPRGANRGQRRDSGGG